MSESGIILDYRGPLNFSVIDSLLIKLKKTKEFASLNKTTDKRVYSMVVECLENICKHSEFNLLNNPAMYSYISVGRKMTKLL